MAGKGIVFVCQRGEGGGAETNDSKNAKSSILIVVLCYSRFSALFFGGGGEGGSPRPIIFIAKQNFLTLIIKSFQAKEMKGFFSSSFQLALFEICLKPFLWIRKNL